VGNNPLTYWDAFGNDPESNSFHNKTQVIAIVFVWLVGLLLGCTGSAPTTKRCKPLDGRGADWLCASQINNVPICGQCNVPNENYKCNPDWRHFGDCCYELNCK
jgi:hypothetical protein